MKNIFWGFLKFSFFGFLILVNSFVFSQTIITVAGDGTAGYFGDNGQSTVAELNLPTGIAIDIHGNYYIADLWNSVVRKVDYSGIITTFAGNGIKGNYSGDGGPATVAEINQTPGLCLDAEGNLYIADGVSRIRMVNTSGIISTFAGNGWGGYSGDGGQATVAEINSPTGVVTDGSGNVFIVDDNNSRIRKVNSSGIITTYAGNGIAGYSGDGASATSAELNYPWGVGIDGSGNIYIGDRSNNVIRKVNTVGIISTFAGNGTLGYSGDGGAATAAELDYTPGVTVDGTGNIYFLDQHNNRVREVNTFGIINTFAGNGTQGYSGDGGFAIDAEVNRPAAIGVDNSGNVYIVDQYNNRVRQVTVYHELITPVSESTFSVSVYPNPSNGIINLQFNNQKITDGFIEILDVTGRELNRISIQGSANTVTLNESLLNNGVYFYRLIESGNTVALGRFIIVK